MFFSMKTMKRILCALVCALVLALLQLGPLQQRILLDARAASDTLQQHDTLCRLECTVGGGAEPGFLDEGPLVVPLPPGATLHLAGRPGRCAVAPKSMLQMPHGIGRLPRIHSAFGDLRLVPHGALLQSPLPTADRRKDSRCVEPFNEPSAHEHASMASTRWLASRLHARCMLPPGTLLADLSPDCL
jgi:hypothetical protein